MTQQRLFDQDSHVKLWLWLSENPTRIKMEWPGWKEYEQQGFDPAYSAGTFNQCFACLYARVYCLTDRCKTECPLEWRASSPSKKCWGPRGLFDRWVSLLGDNSPRALRSKIALARKIALLPVRPGVPYIPFEEESKDASLGLATDSSPTE